VEQQVDSGREVVALALHGNGDDGDPRLNSGVQLKQAPDGRGSARVVSGRKRVVISSCCCMMHSPGALEHAGRLHEHQRFAVSNVPEQSCEIAQICETAADERENRQRREHSRQLRE
jgi:hypothetical protein